VQPRQPGDPTHDPDRAPAEGRPDLDLPGADRPELPPDPETERPERLGERIETGLGTGIATGRPDVLPDVEVPDESM
jgi:hypothetical protein